MEKRIIYSEKTTTDLPSGFSFPHTAVACSDIERSMDEMRGSGRNTVLSVVILTAEEFARMASIHEKRPVDSMSFRTIVTGAGTDGSLADSPLLANVTHITSSRLSEQELSFHLKRAFSAMEREKRLADERNNYKNTLLDMKHDQEDLINIGRALSIEKDPDHLFRLILMLSKKITGADAGSIYIVEELKEGGKQLRFKYSHTFSKELPYEEFVMPLNKNSIAGYVAVTGTILNIPDVYRLSKSDPVAFNSSFDREHNYRSKSMLVVPMRNHLDEIIGVIQLINSKEDDTGTGKVTGNEAFEIVLSTPGDFEGKVVPFASRYESLMEAVAGQAAIAIENNRMMKQIQEQFEEFVKASVTAIESRDIATSGHSFRVAELCKQMALAVNKEEDGVFKDMRFSDMAIKELEYAALLHDFGKVYIDLAIFQKSKKLFPKEFENLMLRFDYLYRCVELRFFMEENDLLRRAREGAAVSDEFDKIRAERESRLGRIREMKETLSALNEPSVTGKDPEDVIREILEELESSGCLYPDGKPMPVITESEKINLEIRRGSLNPSERKEIESHVVHTYNFVSRIPWPPEYRNIPEIALKHHEKPDGTGYPDGIAGNDRIPIQARMMAIADVYDALAATDRPYKKSVPLEKTLGILKEDAGNNKLDAELVDLFIRHRIYEKVDKDSFKTGVG
ncbi:MAG: HD domain-containing phosphohydrolase [Spirochaetota bacterium]|nr:HD domain-containing phosphohydrolase [Spirochaetota bacterium]